jgi:flagellar biosynthesis protein FlhF
MHYKNFRRATVREALQAVKDELGPEALVLSTRMVRSGGISGWMGARVVEVTAAVERDPVSEPRIEASADRLSVHAKNVAARLEASGMERELAESVAAHRLVQGRAPSPQAVRQAVADTLAPLAAGVEPFKGVEVFVGPPGVGKTTTIAKIAAQTRAAADRRVWLVAADGFRVGAVEQLRLYAEIIGAPLFVARSGAELATTINGVRRPMLVDTAGRSPRDTGNAEILDVLAGRDDVRRHLVLPADTTPAQARRILDRFSPSKPDRLVLTRLDETDTVAPLMSLLTEYKLPVSYLAHGQNVPDDLQRATPDVLSEWVLGDTISGACA